ncbi:hypothetical protein E2C01_089181 [Portunus trituberculatus]|uniref:Chitin-binding type-2 domain-containing protein n=1 Tax=Portunus trituberculatus TaxID=210409 RepID=A0A5B7JB94_PORTR|nr:hypothetical protein [Portunus trituberculatus]
MEELQDERADPATTPPTTPPPPGKCEPDCSSAKDGDKVENPKDCHQYYVCFGGSDPIGPVDCPDGQYFNRSASDCVKNGPEECQPSCGGVSSSCTYECGAGIALRADRYDCSTYHDCASGAMMQCDKDKPFFNGKSCQSDESKCCHCNPYCYTDDKKVVDPTDCTKFYYCIKANAIPELPGHCSAGNFDLFTQECSLSAPCLTLCTNVVKPDGCIHTYTCEVSGYFPACPHKCTPDYYHCLLEDIGSNVPVVSCALDTVFHPIDRKCVDPSQCSIKHTWH